jgi:predicted amidohydrolase YtcJ
MARGIENAAAKDEPIECRHRIEHCGFLSDGQIARMAKGGTDPVPRGRLRATSR